jgi:hypothetical protein
VLTTGEAQDFLCPETTVETTQISAFRVHFLRNAPQNFHRSSAPVNIEEQLLHNEQHINTADVSTHQFTIQNLSLQQIAPARQHGDHISTKRVSSSDWKKTYKLRHSLSRFRPASEASGRNLRFNRFESRFFGDFWRFLAIFGDFWLWINFFRVVLD